MFTLIYVSDQCLNMPSLAHAFLIYLISTKTSRRGKYNGNLPLELPSWQLDICKRLETTTIPSRRCGKFTKVFSTWFDGERERGGREGRAEKGDDAVQAGTNEGRAIFASHRVAGMPSTLLFSRRKWPAFLWRSMRSVLSLSFFSNHFLFVFFRCLYSLFLVRSFFLSSAFHSSFFQQ